MAGDGDIPADHLRLVADHAHLVVARKRRSRRLHADLDLDVVAAPWAVVVGARHNSA